MRKLLLAFVGGVVAAALHWSLPQAHPQVTFLYLVFFAFLIFMSARLSLIAASLAGGFWFYLWADDQGPRFCAEFAWFQCRQDILAEPGMRFLRGSWLGEEVESAQIKISELCYAWDPIWGPWAMGLVGGKLEKENQGLTELYRQLGLIHVLVISGSHFTYLSRILRFALGLVPRFFYSIRLFSFQNWLAADLVVQTVCGLSLAFYAMVVGFPPPCQRAFILIVMQIVAPFFRAHPSVSQILVATAGLQALLFPLSFLSLSNFLSWSTAAILLIFPRSPYLPSLPRELAMGLISLTYFGVFSPMGLILNPLLERVWGPVLLLALVGIMGSGVHQDGLEFILGLLHRFLEEAALWQEKLWGASALSWIKPLDFLVRPFTWLLSMLWVLKLLSFTGPDPKSGGAAVEGGRLAVLR